MEQIKILVADESGDSRAELVYQLKNMGFLQIEEANNGEEALRGIGTFQPDVVILDVWLSKVESLQVMRTVRKSGKKQPGFILLTAVKPLPHLVTEAAELGVTNILMKPFDYNALRQWIITANANKPNHIDKEKDLEIQITKLMHRIGVPAHVSGYQYLRAAIMFAVQNNFTLPSVTKVLYPGIAKKYHTAAPRVERAIRHAIEIAWDRGDVDVLNSYFGYTILNTRGKPTNSEFIAMLTDIIRLQQDDR